MRMLLKIDHLAVQNEISDSQRISDILQLVFSNVCTPQNFPSEFGLIHDSINYFVRIANTPFENEEILCLRLFKQLIKHKWGFKAFFQNPKAIAYVLERKGVKTDKEIIEKKYSLVNQVVKE